MTPSGISWIRTAPPWDEPIQIGAAGAPANPTKDGTGYRLATVWLSDTEYHEFLQDLAAVIQLRIANAPQSNRRRRMLYGVALPQTTKMRCRAASIVPSGRDIQQVS